MTAFPFSEAFAQKGFSLLEAEGRRLSAFDVAKLKKLKLGVIRGLGPISDQEFIAFARDFGVALPYDNGPIYSFLGEALDEVTLHYDGISSRDPRKIPDWIVFRVRKASPPGNGGAFHVADAVSVLDRLPKDLVAFLRGTKLRFYGYFADQQKAGRHDEFSFEIAPITTHQRQEHLRVFLPSLGDRNVADSKKVFEGKSVEETLQIFAVLKEALHHEDISLRFYLQDHDVFILNNNLAFHGRERFLTAVERILDRIQTLPE